jgi:glycosyltransferase involved in cell wall biosynthesis
MALAKNLGIGDRINMLGYVNNIPKLMSNFDLLLHLASTESYGQIYIEALLSGLPVLCSRTGVAIDLYESEEPDIILVTTQTPECINKELISFFDKTRLPKEEKVNLFEHLYTHEDSYVYQGIIDCLLKLGGEGKGGPN